MLKIAQKRQRKKNRCGYQTIKTSGLQRGSHCYLQLLAESAGTMTLGLQAISQEGAFCCTCHTRSTWLLRRRPTYGEGCVSAWSFTETGMESTVEPHCCLPAAAKTQQMSAPAPLRGMAPSWSSCRRRMASSRRLPCRAGGSSCSAGRWLMTCSTTSPSTEKVKQGETSGH